MSSLFSARSLSLCLQREDFPKALKDLKKLARERPNELDDPAGVIAAKQLDEALSATFWKPTLDEHGDLVGLEYLADKLPRDALDANAFLATLAKTAIHGAFLILPEGDDQQNVIMRRGKLLDDYRGPRTFETFGTPTFAQPGETVTARFRMNPGGDPAPERIRLHAVSNNGYYHQDAALPFGGVAQVDYDGSAIAPGEERAVSIRLTPDAHGQIGVFFERIPRGRSTPYEFSFHLEIARPAPSNWEILASRTSSSKRPTLSPPDAKRALIQAHRFAARNLGKPGGAFLASVAAAGSIVEVLRAVGLDGTLEGRPSELRPTTDRLPGAEPLFWGLLEAISIYGSDRPGCSPSLWLCFAHAPEFEYWYWIGASASRRIERRSRSS